MILESYGHDVIHVLDRLNPGESDENVFQLALEEKRVWVTLNGKEHTYEIVQRFPKGTKMLVKL